MRPALWWTVVFAAAIPLAGQPYSESPKPRRTLAEMEPVLDKIAAWEFNQSRDPLYEFSEFLQGAFGSPARLREIEDRLLRMLQSNATLPGKDFVCRQLRVIGSDASVPVLAGMLLRPETSDMARYALDGIPGSAAEDALLAALPKGSGKIRIGVINSLGQRRNGKAVPALKALVSSPDSGVREATVGALAAIGDVPALEALAAAGDRDAYLRCAEKVAAGGNSAAAVKAYRQLMAAGEPETVRLAALSGLVAVAGKDSVPDLERELGSARPKAQAAAIRLLNGIPGPQITKLLAGRVTGLPAAVQVKVLAALGDRGDDSARPAVTQALKSSAPAVRVAAVRALATLGDGSSVAILADLAAGAEASEQSAARETLYRMRGAGVEPAIVAGIGSAAGNTKLELIRAAGERGLAAAGDALLQAARDPDREVRREAVRALRNVAGPAHTGALLDVLLKAEDESGRRDAGRALASALKRSGRPQIGGTVAAYQSAENVAVRAALLEVMGQVSADETLPVLRSSLRDSQPEIARAAILALSEWHTPAPLADLLDLARRSPNPAHQVLALRGYVKLIAAPANRSMAETVNLLAEAMRLARQPEEKRAILSSLSNYATRESLRIADEAAADSAVAREAKAAAARIRLSLGAQR
jgi:HEAT repeat protein